MNFYQRVMTAMELRQPDRVPMVEFLIDPAVYQSLLPSARSQADFEEHFEFDAVGCGVKFDVVEENPDGSYVDQWGVTYKPCREMVDHPIAGPIKSEEDFSKYVPPDPQAPARLGELPELVRKYKHDKAVIFHQRAAFMWSAYLMGIDNLLISFLAAPRLAHKVLDMVLQVNMEIARQALRAGADIIVLGDDYADNRGPLFSPAVFGEFIQPRLKKMVDLIHEHGGKVVKHTDGNIWPILDAIVDTGIDALNPIEPAANMDIAQVKAGFGRRVCLIGNIDCGHLLSAGTTEQVEQAVRNCIQAAGGGGGFILSSSNSIHSSVRPENYLAMIEAWRRWRNYESSN